MTNTEIRQKTTEEIAEMIIKTKLSLKDTVVDILQKKEKNVKKARQLKREIARLETILNEELNSSEEIK